MEKVAGILSRLKEPSTFAGFAAIASIFGATPEMTNMGLNVAGCLAGLVAIFLPERKLP
jgi:hypothetical protein